jgi:flagellar M-ring protein FliF
MASNSFTDLTRARDGFRRFAQGFTPGQKAVTIFAILAAVVGGYAVLSVTGKPTYAALFTNLQPADAASITGKLVSAKVPYKLADGGTTVLVPANDVNQERLTLAQAGLPSGGTIGLSLLDKEGITASNMTQQADYLQAIQGELEQTIDSIQGVASSQVNVALPANQDFALNNDNPTGASVMVTMQSGQSLSSGSVEAIVHLVGSSVPNLDSGNVTVADSSGDLLAGPGMQSGGGSNSQTASYDNGLQSKVQEYLTAILGANNADVQVNATLNYDQVATNTQSILPAANGKTASFCTATSASNSTYNGTGTPPGGAAGSLTTVTTIAPATGTATGSTGNGSYVQTQNTQTCETNEQTKTVQQAVGTVTNQSVAVLINSKALPPGVALASLQQGVAAAAGINTARGDTLAFSSMPFNTAAAQQAAKSAAATSAQNKAKAMSSLIRTAVVMLIIGLVLFLVWRSARKARKSAGPLMLSPAALASLQAIQPASEVTSRQPAIAMAKPTPTAELASLTSFIDNQPDDVAELLRSWLDDKKELTPS